MPRTFTRPAKAAAPTKKAAARTAVTTEEEDEDTGKKFKSESLRPGWGGYRKVADEHTSFAQSFKFTEDPQIVKFADDAPFETYPQHWVERSGKQGFVCLEERSERGCPLCDIGDRPRVLSLFNLIVLDPDTGPSMKVLKSGPRLTEALSKRAQEKATSPLSSVYWAFSKSGKGSKTSHKTDPVKARDLEEDFGVSALTDAEIDALMAKKHGFDAVETISPYKEMSDIADEYTGGE